MYTIQLLEGETFTQQSLRHELQRTIKEQGKFQVGDSRWDSSFLTSKEREEVGVEAWQVPTFYMSRIRLTTPKPYCGNHPGPCQVNPFIQRKKPRATWLEWDDWVVFHTMVNNVCDSLQVYANVWTLPQDARGKFWIRKGYRPRQRYDYEEAYVRGDLTRVWNTGTIDQFVEE